ncbi:hypothetical protein FACS189490_10230 [Clostridia bacterium]|nr:hypothetical protein FACS189490_10230 [Clostridia bacterium]
MENIRYVIDRIEGNIAICETVDGMIEVELSRFSPNEPKEGGVFFLRGGNFVRDERAEIADYDRIRAKMDRLRRKNG